MFTYLLTRSQSSGTEIRSLFKRQPSKAVELSPMHLSSNEIAWTHVNITAIDHNCDVCLSPRHSSLNEIYIYYRYRPEMWGLFKPNALVTRWNSLNSYVYNYIAATNVSDGLSNTLVTKWISVNIYMYMWPHMWRLFTKISNDQYVRMKVLATICSEWYGRYKLYCAFFFHVVLIARNTDF